MSITIDGSEKRIGLALSGGGFRSAAFHLGMLRKLEELNLLSKVDLLSGVSGGSIVSAFLAANWGQDDVLDRLESYLTTRSIAVSSFLSGVFSPFHSRLDALAEAYNDHLFNDATLSSLSEGPRVYLNTTNLSTGNMFFFVAGEGGATEMGDYELGQTDASGQKISVAVAASSAFPPVFPPHKLTGDEFPLHQTEYLTLTDGGVYDNLGVNPMFVERNAIDYALVSDGGKPFENDLTPTESSAMVLKEAIGILMEQVRGLQFQRLALAYAADKGPKPIWFSIDSEKGEVREGDAEFASSIGTNLSKLSKVEMSVLTRHAGALCEARINKYAPELLSGSA